MFDTAQAIDLSGDICDESDERVWTEKDLKKEYQVSFVRAGTTETLVFEVEEYIGLLRMLNGKYGNSYRAHTWKVRFNKANGVEYWIPLPGLLQMADWIWNDFKNVSDPRDLGHKGELVHVIFKGRLPKGISRVEILNERDSQ